MGGGLPQITYGGIMWGDPGGLVTGVRRSSAMMAAAGKDGLRLDIEQRYHLGYSLQ